jgi:epsilon-lactone hydrolase
MNDADVLPIQLIPLSLHDQKAIPALQEMFRQFWSAPSVQASPRVGYDAFLALTPPVAGVAFRQSTDPAIPGWICVPEHPVDDQALLYIHGGAYTLGTAPAYRGFVSQIASRARRATYILEYPLAPETALPTAIDVAKGALERLAGMYGKVGVVGDSAGGGLTLATLGKTDAASAAVVFSPWTDLTFSGASIRGRASREILLAEESLREAARGYLGSTSAHDSRASPLLGIPPSLPPLLIQVGSEEILYDDSVRYAQRARTAGHEVTIQEWAGMHHVFQQNVEALQAARSALDDAAMFLEKHMRV